MGTTMDLNNQQQPQRKRSAISIILVIVACIGVAFALLSPAAPYWGYLFIWGDGWSGTPFELFMANQFPTIGFVSGLSLCIISLVLLVMRSTKRSSSP